MSVSHATQRLRWIALGLFVGAFALTLSCESPVPGEKQFRDWVEERYAQPFRDGETDRWVAVFDENAVGMHHTLPAMEGREAIRNFGRMVHENLVVEQFDLTVKEVRVSKTWALTRGSFVSRFVPAMADAGIVPAVEAPATVGKFVLLWELQDDGEWRVILDMGNLDSP
ncbi:MAG: nuclear transport factor 2 family protein [Gammaproteobacteria bacterium]|nr:nuclear transport factor 2 family protein [Gammaproteobacteria bacterium]MDE0414198.1 nuclear transport factor 2 family protein [Gammaproteobacteria bacterium]MDE0455381.1 nuclear transport factor 2 family protein [Gammaproteobacteria bacterium]